MYTEYFGLKIKPFNAVPDPRFLWLNEEQRREMAYLRHALLSQSGFVLITGDVGMGKTVLAKGLAESVTKAASVVYVPDPDMEKLDFFNFIADGFGLGRNFESKSEFLISLKRHLRHADFKNRKHVLLIDEAHRLSHDILQEVRLLSNIDPGDRIQLSAVLIGLPEVNEILQEARNQNVQQRITSSFHLAPFSAESTRAYVIYRLRKAGAARGIFTGPALVKIHSHSGGNPRLVNLLCDHALVTGYAADRKTIDSKIVQECVSELNISFFSATGDSGIAEAVEEDLSEDREAASIETNPAKPSISSGHLPKMKNFIVALVTVLLICIPGYFLLNRIFHPPSPENANDQAVQEMVHILESPPERQDPAVISERAFGHEMGGEPDSYDPIAEERTAEDAFDSDPTVTRETVEVPAAATQPKPLRD